MEETGLVWHWQDTMIEVGATRAGTGPTVLLLPALSSISTRAEMRPLQQRLARRFATLAVDWPGFGDRAHPRVDWRPELYAAFLHHLVTVVAARPFAVVAAGHAGGYLLAQAAAVPGSVGRICLVAPTWRGPLPTMLGRRPRGLAALARAADTPLLGALLYRLNVNRLMVGLMARGHVYADPAWLSGARLAAKLALTRRPGARHAAWRFVTGRLDPATDRAAFLAGAQRAGAPVRVVFGAATPRKSLAEMQALCALPGVHAVPLARGKLAVHEEFPDDVMTALLPVLRGAAA